MSSSRPLLVFEACAYSSQKQSYLPLHFCGPTKDLSLCPALFFTDQPGTCCVTSYITSGKDSGMLKIGMWIIAKLMIGANKVVIHMIVDCSYIS